MSGAEAVTSRPLLQRSELILDEELCLNLRGRLLVCQACSDQCHRDALQLSADAVDLDTELCTGCGGCIPACPAGVMRMTGFSPVRFLQTARDNRRLHLHCGASRDQGGGVVIPCFKLLDGRLVGALAGAGVEEILLHGLDQCDGCDMGDARPAVEAVQATLDQWFGDRGPVLERATAESEQDPGERLREDQPHMDRRSFLRLLGAKATSGAVTWFCPASDRAEEEAALQPFFQAEGQPQRPVVYQQLLADAAPSLPWLESGPLPWRGRTITEACSACLVCGERCPTGALQAVAGDGGRQISFQPALCTDCSLCERLCPERSIAVADLRLVADLQRPRGVLMHRRTRACSGCGQPFIPERDEELCPVCSNERDLDEEWLDMLEC